MPILFVYNGPEKSDYTLKWSISFSQKLAAKYLVTMISSKGDSVQPHDDYYGEESQSGITFGHM